MAVLLIPNITKDQGLVVTRRAAEILQQGRVIVVQYFLCFLPERECSGIFQEEQL